MDQNIQNVVRINNSRTGRPPPPLFFFFRDTMHKHVSLLSSVSQYCLIPKTEFYLSLTIAEAY